MYKEDLVLNNLQWLICHKTKPNLLSWAECDAKYIFLSRIQLDWIQSFPFPRLVAIPILKRSVCLTIYALLGMKRTDAFMPFPRDIKMKGNTVLFRIWNLVANSISYNYNHNAKHTSCAFDVIVINIKRNLEIKFSLAFKYIWWKYKKYALFIVLFFILQTVNDYHLSKLQLKFYILYFWLICVKICLYIFDSV